MIQDVTDLKENESGDASGVVDASLDWDSISASNPFSEYKRRPGDRGCLSIFGDRPDQHRMFAEQVTAECFARTVDAWKAPRGKKTLPHRKPMNSAVNIPLSKISIATWTDVEYTMRMTA